MKFREAIRTATIQAMERDPAVFLIGVGIVDPKAVWGTLAGTLEQFGAERVVEGPLAEEALTGICVGAATMGMRPLLVHHRVDFVMLSMNQIINHAAKWRQMFGGQHRVPMVIRAIVGRGWGNGPQHTQSHHALFSHVPGLKTVVPTTPYDAKGLLLAAMEEDEPVIYLEHRWFHDDDGPVPETPYVVPIGQAAVVRQGADALRAAAGLEQEGLSAEVIDVRTLRPLDVETIVQSVTKTGRLVAADSDWGPCGVTGEIIACVAERAHAVLKAKPVRVVWPDSAVPSSQALEGTFYPGAAEISAAVAQVCARSSETELVQSTVKRFEGPF
jgi:pyruvate dehydrogenase E1 component beta subunit